MSSTEQALIFDRTALRQRRARHALRFGEADFLFRDVCDRLIERMDDIDRTFDTALVLGGRDGALATALQATSKVNTAFTADLSPALLPAGHSAVCDEDLLPFKEQSLDLIVSPMALHLVNDLPGALIQLRRALKPDGLLLAAFPGGNTLANLRQVFLHTEAEITGGAAPRFHPNIDMRDAGALLGRAGFALPVTDIDQVRVSYRDPFRILNDLRLMGEANVLTTRTNRPLRRDVLLNALQTYQQEHTNENGISLVQFDMVFMTAWAPHPDQPKPARRGSATASLAEALNAVENSAGEKAGS